jgi:hypothetical protein
VLTQLDGADRGGDAKALAVVSNSGTAARCGDSRVAGNSFWYHSLVMMRRQSRDNLSARSCA